MKVIFIRNTRWEPGRRASHLPQRSWRAHHRDTSFLELPFHLRSSLIFTVFMLRRQGECGHYFQVHLNPMPSLFADLSQGQMKHSLGAVRWTSLSMFASSIHFLYMASYRSWVVWSEHCFVCVLSPRLLCLPGFPSCPGNCSLRIEAMLFRMKELIGQSTCFSLSWAYSRDEPNSVFPDSINL